MGKILEYGETMENIGGKYGELMGKIWKTYGETHEAYGKRLEHI